MVSESCSPLPCVQFTVYGWYCCVEQIIFSSEATYSSAVQRSKSPKFGEIWSLWRCLRLTGPCPPPYCSILYSTLARDRPHIGWRGWWLLTALQPQWWAGCCTVEYSRVQWDHTRVQEYSGGNTDYTRLKTQCGELLPCNFSPGGLCCLYCLYCLYCYRGIQPCR